MKKYKASNGATFGNKKAQIYGRELDEIKKRNGRLTPKIVLEEAKNKKSPLHSYFEWDNKKASDKYRLAQAGSMITHICEVIVIKGKEKNLKGFYNVTDENKKSFYVTLKEASTEPDYKRQVIDKLIKELIYVTELMETFKKYS